MLIIIILYPRPNTAKENKKKIPNQTWPKKKNTKVGTHITKWFLPFPYYTSTLWKQAREKPCKQRKRKQAETIRKQEKSTETSICEKSTNIWWRNSEYHELPGSPSQGWQTATKTSELQICSRFQMKWKPTFTSSGDKTNRFPPIRSSACLDHACPPIHQAFSCTVERKHANHYMDGTGLWSQTRKFQIRVFGFLLSHIKMHWTSTTSYCIFLLEIFPSYNDSL